MDQTITDGEGTQIYGAAGSVCQPGMCCPCCGSVDFDITDASGQPTTGKIEKVRDENSSAQCHGVSRLS